MAYAVSLRIPLDQYLPFDLIRGRQYVNVSAFASQRPTEKFVTLNENCRNAEVLEVSSTRRSEESFDFNLDN